MIKNLNCDSIEEDWRRKYTTINNKKSISIDDNNKIKNKTVRNKIKHKKMILLKTNKF